MYEELDDIPEESTQISNAVDDEMMVLDEEAEMEARLAEYEAQSTQRPGSPSLSDDEDYDSLFIDILSQQQQQHQQQASHDFGLSGDMDMS